MAHAASWRAPDHPGTETASITPVRKAKAPAKPKSVKVQAPDAHEATHAAAAPGDDLQVPTGAASAAPAPKAWTGPEPTTMEELLAGAGTTIRNLKSGDVLDGIVVRVDPDEVLVDYEILAAAPPALLSAGIGIPLGLRLGARETRANGRHRGEALKLFVHSSFRRGGLARRLMAELEEAARAAGITLLLMDTRKDSQGERLCEALGYTRWGEVPDYARDPDGTLKATSFYYRRLTA